MQINNDAPLILVKSSIFHLIPAHRGPKGKPAQTISNGGAYQGEFIENASILCQNGTILICDTEEKVFSFIRDQASLLKIDAMHLLDKIITQNFTGKIIVPAFVDTHNHYAQLELIASYGKDLISWLDHYTFPLEKKFSDPQHCQDIAELYVKELFAHGIAATACFPTSSKVSLKALIEATHSARIWLFSGTVLMDQNAPEYLIDDYKKQEEICIEGIESYKNYDRFTYTLTPRFALTSSDKQLASCRNLLEKYPYLFLQTHLAETKEETDLIAKAHPGHKSYLSLYDDYGLLSDKSLLAHCIYLNEYDWDLAQKRNVNVSHCPSSNLFLGSGLYELAASEKRQISCSIGSDIGAGCSLSMFETLQDAYKVSSLQGNPLDPIDGFALATIRGAHCLGLDEKLGNFLPGKEASFVVIDPALSPVLKMRWRQSQTIHDKLFTLMMLCKQEHIVATFIAAAEKYKK